MCRPLFPATDKKGGLSWAGTFYRKGLPTVCAAALRGQSNYGLKAAPEPACRLDGPIHDPLLTGSLAAGERLAFR